MRTIQFLPNFRLPQNLNNEMYRFHRNWIKTARTVCRFGWNPHGEVDYNASHYVNELRTRVRANPRAIQYEYPRRRISVEWDPDCHRDGEEPIFPEEPNMLAARKFLELYSDTEINERIPRIYANVDTLLHFAGYGPPGEWQINYRHVYPQHFLDMYYLPPTFDVKEEFAREITANHDETFSKSYRCVLGQLEKKELCVMTRILAEDRKSAPKTRDTEAFREFKSQVQETNLYYELFTYQQDERPNAFQRRWDGAISREYMRCLLTRPEKIIVGTLDGDWLVDFEMFDMPEEEFEASRISFERLEENMDRLLACEVDGYYIVKGRDWFITEVQLVQEMNWDARKKDIQEIYASRPYSPNSEIMQSWMVTNSEYSPTTVNNVRVGETKASGGFGG